MEQGLTGKVARTAEPLAARDIHNHPDHYHVEGSGEERFRSYLGIPLLNDEHLLGVLVIQTELTRTFFRGDIRELHQAGQAVLHDLAAGKVAKAG
jgi:phosphotransferase system enzyme I (PtsP)